VFDDEPLRSAVARINRYAKNKILLDDATLDALTVSGVFNTGDAHAFVEGVTAVLPLAAQPRSDGNIALRRRS
jgi:transmembrane sensor